MKVRHGFTSIEHEKLGHLLTVEIFEVNDEIELIVYDEVNEGEIVYCNTFTRDG